MVHGLRDVVQHLPHPLLYAFVARHHPGRVRPSRVIARASKDPLTRLPHPKPHGVRGRVVVQRLYRYKPHIRSRGVVTRLHSAVHIGRDPSLVPLQGDDVPIERGKLCPEPAGLGAQALCLLELVDMIHPDVVCAGAIRSRDVHARSPEPPPPRQLTTQKMSPPSPA